MSLNALLFYKGFIMIIMTIEIEPCTDGTIIILRYDYGYIRKRFIRTNSLAIIQAEINQIVKLESKKWH